MDQPSTATIATAAATTDGSPVIRLEAVHKTYDLGEIQVHALRGVTLQIRAGEFVAVMGASGSGKSTLMNILGCLDRPTRGQYFLDGSDVSQRSKVELARIRPQAGICVPAVQPAGAHLGTRKRGAADRVCGDNAPGEAATRPGGARTSGSGRPGGALPQPTLRRATAAGGHRPGAGEPAGG